MDGADDGYVTAQNIEELRKSINIGPPQNLGQPLSPARIDAVVLGVLWLSWNEI